MRKCDIYDNICKRFQFQYVQLGVPQGTYPRGKNEISKRDQKAVDSRPFSKIGIKTNIEFF